MATRPSAPRGAARETPSPSAEGHGSAQGYGSGRDAQRSAGPVSAKGCSWSIPFPLSMAQGRLPLPCSSGPGRSAPPFSSAAQSSEEPRREHRAALEGNVGPGQAEASAQSARPDGGSPIELPPPLPPARGAASRAARLQLSRRSPGGRSQAAEACAGFRRKRRSSQVEPVVRPFPPRGRTRRRASRRRRRHRGRRAPSRAVLPAGHLAARLPPGCS